MKIYSIGLVCSTLILAGCAERHDPYLAGPGPVSTVGPSYTTVPLMIDSGAGTATSARTTTTGGAASDTAAAAGQASAGARGDLLTAVDSILANWKPQPRDLARALIAEYGAPHEVTQSRMIWYNNGPWKRTELFNAEIPHNFPAPHNDMLEQVIDYRVPPEKVQEVLAYDGSVLIDRTRGEMAARCGSEEMNILALNLAHDVITGQRTAEAARESYAATASQFAQGAGSPLIEKLQFITAVGPTADPDQPHGASAAPGEPVP